MKRSIGMRRMRSAKAPQIRAGVMIANMSSYATNKASGMCGAIGCPLSSSMLLNQNLLEPPYTAFPSENAREYPVPVLSRT